MRISAQEQNRGFTLLEIMVVVILIGVMLAMAIPGFTAVRERTRVSAFLNDFRAVQEAVNRYNLEEGHYPVGTDGPPADFLEYIREDIIMNTTVIGGNWSVDANSSDYYFALGVTGYQVDDEVIEKIDSGIDDGDIATGRMTKTGDGEFYFVIEY